MADQNFEIKISTKGDPSGAVAVDKSLEQLRAELKGLKADMEKLPTGSAEFTTTAAQVKALEGSISSAAGASRKHGEAVGDAGKGMGKMGQLANQASFQVNDFAVQVGMGTSAVTAFAQQAPQLLGAFASAGVLTAGTALSLGVVSALIPILTYGLPALAKAFGGVGEASADSLKAAVDAAKELEKYTSRRNVDIEKNVGEDMAKRLAAVKELASDKGQKSADNLSFDKQKIMDDAALKRANSRLEVVELETKMATAAGEALLKLTKDREAAERRILEIEERKAELVRQADERAAREKVDIAKRAADEMTTIAEGAQARAQSGKKEAENVSGKLTGELELRTQSLKIAMEQRDAASANRGTQADFANYAEISAWQKAVDANYEPSPREMTLITRLEELGKTNDISAKNAETATSDAAAAAKALKDATYALENLQRTQTQQRTTEAGMSQISDRWRLLEQEKAAAVASQGIADTILPNIPNAAGNQAVQQILGKLKQLNADGQQKGEVDEVTNLLLQLQAKMTGTNSESVKAYQQIITNQETQMTLLGGINTTLSNHASRLDELKRERNTTDQILSNPNP